MKKVAYTITKNGKSNHLPKTIENLENWVDYHLISVDKKSTDGTYKYVKNHDAVDKVLVHNGKWPKQEPEIRRKAYKYTRLDNPDADILIALDDDEIIPNQDAADTLFQFMLAKNLHFGNIGMFHMWKENKYRADHLWRPQNSPHRIIQNLNLENPGNWASSGPHCGRLPTDNIEGVKETGMFGVMHFGWYLPEEKQKQKLKQKIENDTRPLKELGEGQITHYKSFFQEPELEPIPEHWNKHIYKS